LFLFFKTAQIRAILTKTVQNGAVLIKIALITAVIKNKNNNNEKGLKLELFKPEKGLTQIVSQSIT